MFYRAIFTDNAVRGSNNGGLSGNVLYRNIGNTKVGKKQFL